MKKKHKKIKGFWKLILSKDSTFSGTLHNLSVGSTASTFFHSSSKDLAKEAIEEDRIKKK